MHLNKLAGAASLALSSALLLSGCGGDGSFPAPYTVAGDTVQLNAGVLAASAESTGALRVFKAIPFAAPPVGALRWKAPQPVFSWTGVRRSDAFSAACYQGNRPAGLLGAILYQDPGVQSEDCLYLNVWTGAAPAAAEKRPVMLLLHGGGYQLGAGSQANYNGTGLAAKGAVVVTLNYRLGPLGFLAHPELNAESAQQVSGNYALLDAIVALKWVQANIAAFGGDPSNVTLYSESAGAGLSSVLLGSPLAANLFHKLVTESLGSLPAGCPNTTMAQATAAGSTYARNLGAADLAALRAALRAKTPQELMAGTGSVIAPIVDGVVWPDQLDLLMAAGTIHDVPMLLGWNADEGTPYPPFATTLAGYEATATARYGALASQFKQVYPVASDADVLAMAYAPMRDSLFAWQPWTLARAHAARRKAKTFLYFFNRRPPYAAGQKFNEQDPPEKYGAYHSLEQVYFYNNLERSTPARPYTDLDRQIAATASSYLVNFARVGDPNASGLPAWPEFTGPASQTMAIGDTIAPAPVPFRPALDFFDAFYTQSLARPLPF